MNAREEIDAIKARHAEGAVTGEDIEFLLRVADSVVGRISAFTEFAGNIRYNNRTVRSDYEERAKTYDSAAAHLERALKEALEKAKNRD